MLLFKQLMIGCVLAFACAIPAAADTGTFQLSVSTLEADILGLATFDGGTPGNGQICAQDLSNCGIFKILATIVSGAPAGSSITGGVSPSGAFSGGATGSNWTYTAAGTIADDSANAGVTMISTNTHIVAGNTYSSIPGTPTGNGLWNATTNLGFIRTDTTGAFTSPVTFTLQVFMVGLNTTTGAQDAAKTSSSSFNVTLNAVPEPSSVILFLTGIPAIALLGRRGLLRRG